MNFSSIYSGQSRFAALAGVAGVLLAGITIILAVFSTKAYFFSVSRTTNLFDHSGEVL